MAKRFISIGFNNMVNADRVISVIGPDSLPSKRLISEARDNHKLVDASCGRKTRAILMMDSGHVILCGLQTETIGLRLNEEENNDEQ